MSRSRVPRLRAATAIIAAALLGTALVACSPGEGGGSATPKAEVLNLQFVGSPVSLNPALAATGGSTPYVHLAYDPLIYMDGEGNLVPDLAVSWEFITDDNTVFEMKLREGVTFASGKPFDANAAKASMDYFLGAGGNMIRQVGPIEKIEAVDETTLRVTYSAPFPNAAMTMTQYYQIGAIIGPDGLADPDSLLTKSDGTGQYIFDAEETITDSVYVYKKNPEYWAPDAQVFEVIKMNVIQDPNAAIAALTTGQVDFAHGGTATAESAKSAGLDIVRAPYYISTLQILDRGGELNPALGDERVRQAIQMAMDRPALIAAASSPDYAVENGQVVNEGAPGWIKGLGEEYDIERAKELLAEAGYPDGFTMVIGTTPAMDPQSILTQAIATNLAEIGITAEIVVESTGLPRLLERSELKELESMVLPVTGYDVAAAVATIRDRPNLNPWGVTDAEIDRLINESMVSSGADRVAILEQLNERANEVVWVAPVFSEDNLYYVAPTITNVKASSGNPNPVPIGPERKYAWQPAEG